MKQLASILVLCAMVAALGSCTVEVGDTGDEDSSPPAVDVGATAPSAADSGEVGPNVVILKVGDQYDKATGEVTSQTRTFAPDTPLMHVSAGITGLTAGTMVQGTLRAIEVTNNEGTVLRDIELATVEVEAPAEESTIHFEFNAPDTGWPPGAYAVDIVTGGEVIETVELTVE